MIRTILDQLADPYELWSWRPCTKSLTSQFEGFFKYLSRTLFTTQSAMQKLNSIVRQVMTDCLDEPEMAEITAWPF